VTRRRAWLPAVVAAATVLLAGVVLGELLRGRLLEAAQTDLDAEFDRRAAAALATVDAEIRLYEERLASIAAFAGFAADAGGFTPADWERFVRSTGILDDGGNTAVGYVAIVEPAELLAFLTGEVAVGTMAADAIPLIQPNRFFGTDTLYPQSRFVTSDPDATVVPLFDLGASPDALETVEAALASGSPRSFEYPTAAELEFGIDEETQDLLDGAVELGLDVDGFLEDVESVIAFLEHSPSGTAIPVFDREGEGVIGFVMAATVPSDAVAWIDESLGEDLTISLTVVTPAGDEVPFYGGTEAAGGSRRATSTGRVHDALWSASVDSTPAFASRLDRSAPDLAAALVVALAVLCASLILLRQRFRRRAGLALDRLAGAEARLGRDPLTGLHNRAGLDVALADLQAADGSVGPGVAVLFVDLDGLKRVNDTLGHEAGDAMIRGAARRIAHAVRAGDVVARIGGDEFLIVAPGIHDAEVARRIGVGVLAGFDAPVELVGAERIPRIEASVGVAVSVAAGGIADAIARADAAMYAAKRHGGGRVVVDGDTIAVLRPEQQPVA
jgi:diguanylate cyclase (GGDEF)-like protein